MTWQLLPRSGPGPLPGGSTVNPVPTAATLLVDPALAPEITNIVFVGTSIELTWTDPTDGEARFVLYRVDGSVLLPLTQSIRVRRRSP